MFTRLHILKYKFNNEQDVKLTLYFEDLTLGVIRSWSGQYFARSRRVGSGQRK